MKTMRVIRDEPLTPRKEKTPSLKTLLAKATTLEEKRALITQANPNHYAFGEKLDPKPKYQGEEYEND